MILYTKIFKCLYFREVFVLSNVKIRKRTWFKSFLCFVLVMITAVQMSSVGFAADSQKKNEAQANVNEIGDLLVGSVYETVAFTLALAHENGLINRSSALNLFGAKSQSEDEIVEIGPTLRYDPATGILGRVDGRGILLSGFDYDVKSRVWTSSMNSWQKKFGYGALYDWLAPLGMMFFETIRIRFEHDGYEYLLQFWKGRYGITSGGEIGFYKRVGDDLSAVYMGVGEDELPLVSMKLYNYNKCFVDMSAREHWWLTGFKLFRSYKAENMTLISTIDLQNDALEIEFEKVLPEYSKLCDFDYSIEDGKVNIEW